MEVAEERRGLVVVALSLDHRAQERQGERAPVAPFHVLGAAPGDQRVGELDHRGHPSALGKKLHHLLAQQSKSGVLVPALARLPHDLRDTARGQAHRVCDVPLPNPCQALGQLAGLVGQPQ